MLIDWFTVGAQALNFILLVWLMKRFLYQPVLTAIAAREKRIADQIADAAAQAARAAAERKTFEDKQAAFDQQRDNLLEQATADARAEGVRVADEVRQAAAVLAGQHQQALAAEAAHLQELIAGRAAHEVFAVARKTLTDLADVSLEARMVDVWTRRLAALTAAGHSQLATALQQSTEPAVVRSHFDLPAEQQAALQHAINVSFSADVPLRFERAGDSICGIQFSVGGRQLAWTIDEYLRDLEHDVSTLLTPATKTVAKVAIADTPHPDPTPQPLVDPVPA